MNFISYLNSSLSFLNFEKFDSNLNQSKSLMVNNVFVSNIFKPTFILRFQHDISEEKI